MRRSVDIWVGRAMCITATCIALALSIAGCVFEQRYLGSATIASIGLVWASFVRKQFTRQHGWYVDSRGICGFGVPDGITVEWQDISCVDIFFPTYMRAITRRGAVWVELLPFVFPRDAASGESALRRTLSQWFGGDVTFHAVMPSIGRKRALRLLAWVSVSLFVTSILSHIVALLARAAVPGIGRKDLALLTVLTSFMVVVSSAEPDKSGRMLVTSYWVVLIGCGIIVGLARPDMALTCLGWMKTTAQWALPLPLISLALLELSRRRP